MHGKKQHFWIDRKDGRINTDLTCRVGLEQGTPCTAQILNLSAGGLKFSCTEETIVHLLPEDQRTPGLVSDVIIEVRFQLPLAGRKKPALIQCNAGIVHTERLAQDVYHIGVQFLGLGDTDKKSLQAYLDDGETSSENS